MLTDYDQLLKVKTGNQGIGAGVVAKGNRPYEATPYSILYTLFQASPLQATDHFIDYGSGKGRLLFYVHYLFNSHVTGIEVDQALYEKSLINQKHYLEISGKSAANMTIKNCSAETHEVQASDNVFYFFNPFSLPLLKKVLEQILYSVMSFPREVKLIFYYPFDEYIEYIDQQTPFQLAMEIKVPHLQAINPDERFLIYQLNEFYHV